MPKEKRIDCPALRMRGDSYPLGNRVPRTVRMLKTVTADPMPVSGSPYIKGDILVAPIDEIFKVWTTSHGAVAAVLPNGTRLVLHPEEFEVETWHDPSKKVTVGPVVFGFDDRATKVTQEAYSIFLARKAASREKIEDLQQRLNAADQLSDELKRDADRYRWLRDPDTRDGLEPEDLLVVGIAEGEDIVWLEQMDQAIDANLESVLPNHTGDATEKVAQPFTEQFLEDHLGKLPQ